MLGANGAGKTTTLRAISGLIRPWSGEIHFDGRRLRQTSPEVRALMGLGHVPEGRGIFSTLTVEENLMLGVTARRDKGADAVRDRRRLLELFPLLGEKLRMPASSLSGGQQQMLALARGLMGRPQLLMIDELSFGLAPIMVNGLFELIREIRKDGTAFLLVEQNAGVLAISDRTYVIAGGRSVLEGASAELIKQNGRDRLARVYLSAGTDLDS